MSESVAARRKAKPIADDRIDLKDPDLHASDAYHAAFERIRVEEPVYWNPESDSTGFWAITRYDDVLRVVEDTKTFSSAIEIGGFRIFNAQDVALNPVSHLGTMDPPLHTQLRRLLQPLFAPPRIARMEAGVRACLKDVIDRIGPAGECEFVSAVAEPLSLSSLIDLFDIPESDAGDFLRWSKALVGDDDEDFQPSIEHRLRCIHELEEYAVRLRAERAGKGGDDFPSLLARAELDSRPISDDSYTGNFGGFVVAANENTRHVLSFGILTLSLHPEERRKLLADRSLIGSAVKELVRLSSPLLHTRRTATRDVELGGKLIRKGDKVVVWYFSANRDETKWANAKRFNVDRFADPAATPHIAFGRGAHRCLGWRVAEVSLAVALEGLLERLPDIRATGSPERLRSNFIGGIKSLPVVFTPERRA